MCLSKLDKATKVLFTTPVLGSMLRTKTGNLDSTLESPLAPALPCLPFTAANSKATLRQGLKLHYGTCPEAKKTLQHPLSSSDTGKDLLTLQLALEVKMMLAEIFPW